MTEGEPKFDAVRAAADVVSAYVEQKIHEAKRNDAKGFFYWKRFESSAVTGKEPDYYEEQEHPLDPRNPDRGDENPFGNDYIPGF